MTRSRRGELAWPVLSSSDPLLSATGRSVGAISDAMRR